MEKNDIEIIQMSIDNFEEIKDALITDFDDFWNIDTLKDELNQSNSLYIIAKEEKKILGFAGIKIILDEAELMNIVTKKDSRNCGIASNMIENIIKYCTKSGIKKINLEVNIQNSIAINLYKKYNFKEVGRRKKYYNNTDDAILMTLECT